MIHHDPPDQVEIDGLRVPGENYGCSLIGIIGSIILVLGIGLLIFSFISRGIISPNGSFSFLLEKDAEAVTLGGSLALIVIGGLMSCTPD